MFNRANTRLNVFSHGYRCQTQSKKRIRTDEWRIIESGKLYGIRIYVFLESIILDLWENPEQWLESDRKLEAFYIYCIDGWFWAIKWQDVVRWWNSVRYCYDGPSLIDYQHSQRILNSDKEIAGSRYFLHVLWWQAVVNITRVSNTMLVFHLLLSWWTLDVGAYRDGLMDQA